MSDLTNQLGRLDLMLTNLNDRWGNDLLAAEINTFSDGGCLIAAEAIADWAGPRARLVAVTTAEVLEHWAVEIDGLYADALGVRDRSDFEYDLSDPENGAMIFYQIELLDPADPTTQQRLESWNGPRLPALSAAIAADLAAEIDRDELWRNLDAARAS